MPITAIHAEPISGTIVPDLAIISSLGRHLVGQYVLVRVHDEAGRVGLGEASVTSVWSGETQAGTIALIEQVLAPLVVGAEAKQGIRLKFVVGAVEAELAAQRARRMVERGWRSIKVKVGRHEHPRVDVERLRAVREAIGPDVWLSVDANGGYTVEQAVWAATQLEKLDVTLFEQP